MNDRDPSRPDDESVDELADRVVDLEAIGRSEMDDGDGWIRTNLRIVSEIARHATDEAPPRAIGTYVLQERLGGGGMGEVWLANQTAPVQREVALKLIRTGMDTARVVARFEAERQALALMEHPSVARVFDAGSAPDGRPYFVMEYVRGLPITDHCDLHRYSTKQRLEIFSLLCEAVQHAHHRGLVHRDIKPSNVLVEMIEGRANPKVIDFGIAKAVAVELTTRTLRTEEGQILGTPEYMSPEQADLSGSDVDARTDIYSLGVLLYELLTGVLPFDPDRLRSGGLAGIERTLRTQEPLTPSERVSTGHERSDEAHGDRVTSRGALITQLRGDLDWITMKAMEKDRSRRYASPTELAEDIRRHLHHEPVAASPPSTMCRMRKFVLRHRVSVMTAVGAAVLLLAGSGATAWQALRARRAELEAVHEAKTAAAVNEFLLEMLSFADPVENVAGREMTVAEAVDEAAARLPGPLAGRPQVEASVRRTLGAVYGNLSRFPDAVEQLERAAAIAESTGSVDDQLAAIAELADVSLRAADLDAAARWIAREESLALTRHGTHHAEFARALTARARWLAVDGRFVAADSVFARASAIHASLPPIDRAQAAQHAHAYGAVLRALGRPEEAEAVFRENLAAIVTQHGERSAQAARAKQALSLALLDRGELEEAEPLAREVIDIETEIFGPDHPSLGVDWSNLSSILQLRGDLARADSAAKLAESTLRNVYGDGHPRLLPVLSHRGAILLDLDRVDEAVSVERDALAIARRHSSATDPALSSAVNNLAAALRRSGAHAEAAEMFREARSLTVARYGTEEHPEVAVITHNLAMSLADAGELDAADAAFREALDLGARTLPEGNAAIHIFRSNHGNFLRRRGRFAEAERTLLRAYEALAEALGPEHVRATRTAGWLAELYDATERPEDAERWQERSAPDARAPRSK